MNLYLHGRAAHHARRLDLRGSGRSPLRCRPHQSAVRHQGRQPGARPRRLRHLDEQQAAQLPPARPDHPQAGRRAAVVVPDNCLFADQAGEVFKILMQDCDLHTVLRCRAARSALQPGHQDQRHLLHQGLADRARLDLRRPHQRAGSPRKPAATPEHFAEFEKCFGADPNGRSKRDAADSKEDRWRFPHHRNQRARLQARQPQVAQGRISDDPDELPSRKSWRLMRSLN